MLVRQVHLGVTKDWATKCPLRCPDEIGLAHSHAFRHNGDDRSFTGSTEQPPQLIPEEPDGFENEAGTTFCGEELALFCEVDMLDQALALEQDSEIINGLVDDPAHTHPNPDHQPLVTIEVKKGESASTFAAIDGMHSPAALNGMYFCPGEGDVAKQKRRQPAEAKKDTKKEKRAKCR